MILNFYKFTSFLRNDIKDLYINKLLNNIINKYFFIYYFIISIFLLVNNKEIF